MTPNHRHVDALVFLASLNARYMWIYTNTSTSLFLGKELATFTRLDPCLQMLKNHCLKELDYSHIFLEQLKTILV